MTRDEIVAFLEVGNELTIDGKTTLETQEAAQKLAGERLVSRRFVPDERGSFGVWRYRWIGDIKRPAEEPSPPAPSEVVDALEALRRASEVMDLSAALEAHAQNDPANRDFLADLYSAIGRAL